MVTFAPSILSADFAHLEDQCRAAVDSGAEWLHLDIMDGHFVPNITFGPIVAEALQPLREETGAILDAHLMVSNPEDHLEALAKAGVDIATVHVETCPHLHRTIQLIKKLGMRAGVTLNPGTPLVLLEEVLPDVDLVLIMSVNPGASGQRYIPQSTSKIRRARRMLNAIGSHAYLEIDGGVGPENIAEVVAAGANVVVAGSAVFGGDRTIAENMDALQKAVYMTA